MSSSTKSGIQTSADGTSYIPASKRADGSTRKEIRVRPGYRPPEDVETYKNRSAESWKTRGSAGIPGTETTDKVGESDDTRNKNAKRREAAKKRKEAEAAAAGVPREELSEAMKRVDVSEGVGLDGDNDADVERQKKIRNQLKKLRAVRDLKEKKARGEKLSHDQLMKIGKEDELQRDLKKLDYNGPEMAQDQDASVDINEDTG